MSTIPIPCKDVSCQQLLSTNDVIHYGVLRHRQTVHRIVENTLPTVINIKWSRRYAVLHNCCLYLFKDEMSLHPLHCSTSLFGFTTCAACSQEVSAHIPWPFKLSCDLETRSRVYYFSSASQNELLTWVEKIQQQMVIANSTLTFVTPKVATFGSFPPDAPSAEALPLRARERAASDSAAMSSVVHRERALPPTPNTESSGEHASGDTDDDNDSDYDELIDFSKQSKTVVAAVIQGLKRFMSFSRSDTEHGKMQHSFSSPSRFEAHKEETDSDDSSTTSDNPGSTLKSTTSPPLSIYEPMSPNSTLRAKPMTAVKPCVSVKRTSPQPPPPLEQRDLSPNFGQQSPPKPTPRKRTFSDSRTCVEPGLMGAYWSKSANEGEELMKSLTTVGTFMIRESNEPGRQTLMVRCEDSVRKYRIYADEEGKFYLDASNPRFTTRSALVSHYKCHYLPQRTVVLTIPYSTVLLSTANAAANVAAAAATYIEH